MTVTLQTRNLHKTYDKEVKAVQGIDLEIKKGEVFGLLGPNGAGKTTLIKMLVGILKPDKGEILFNGIKLNGTTELKGMIGYAPQELVFYPFLTVLENMQLYASLYSIKNTRKRIDEILELFQLTELSKRQAEKMSGGQKRRLNIALSLLHSPQILFLDEPSSGMDPQSRNVLWESVEQLKEKEGVTILLSTHLMEVADKLSDRVAIIDHGKVLTVGTPDELKSKHASIETVEIQFAKNI
ncbi:MAG: ABC transporter ATP-binding protein, partial [Candidatus Heimdallarchaeaceae archaeon]